MKLENGMSLRSKSASLHALLFEEGRTLENFKFFPGDDRGLTAGELCDAAAAAVRSALQRGPIDSPPRTGKIKSAI